MIGIRGLFKLPGRRRFMRKHGARQLVRADSFAPEIYTSKNRRRWASPQRPRTTKHRDQMCKYSICVATTVQGVCLRCYHRADTIF